MTLALGCEATIGPGSDGGARMDAGVVRPDAGGMDASVPDRDAANLDAANLDAAGSVDAPIGVDPFAPDAGTDSGVLECRPEPRDCSPSSVTMEDYCIDGVSCYLAVVQSAVRGAIMAHPEWFDSSGSCSIILDVDAFLDAVVADIVAHGVCAIRDPNAPGEEVTLKYSNAFTENFDIVASTGCARYGSAIYTSTCFPAWW
jgi:hypothetical protein